MGGGGLAGPESCGGDRSDGAGRASVFESAALDVEDAAAGWIRCRCGRAVGEHDHADTTARADRTCHQVEIAAVEDAAAVLSSGASFGSGFDLPPAAVSVVGTLRLNNKSPGIGSRRSNGVYRDVSVGVAGAGVSDRRVADTKRTVCEL